MKMLRKFALTTALAAFALAGLTGMAHAAFWGNGSGGGRGPAYNGWWMGGVLCPDIAAVNCVKISFPVTETFNGGMNQPFGF